MAFGRFIFRSLCWLAVGAVMYWVAGYLPDEESIWKSILGGATTAGGTACGIGLALEVSRYRKERIKGAEPSPSTLRGELVRILIWALVILALYWLWDLQSDAPATDPVKISTMVAFFASLIWLFVAILQLRAARNAKQARGWFVMNISLGMTIYLVLIGIFFIFCSVYFLILFASKPLPAFPRSVGIPLLLLSFAAIGALLIYGPRLLAVRYNDNLICTRLDWFSIRTRCHRWDDLDKIDASDDALTLHFSGGGRVYLTRWLDGYKELREFARTVVARGESEGE